MPTWKGYAVDRERKIAARNAEEAFYRGKNMAEERLSKRISRLIEKIEDTLGGQKGSE